MGVLKLVFVFFEKPVGSPRSGQERHDDHQRQRRFDGRLDQSDPTETAGDEYVDWPVRHMETPHGIGRCHPGNHQQQPRRGHRVLRVWVEHGDDPQPDGVIGHRQQQQEVDRRM